jgi:hypothetical protein
LCAIKGVSVVKKFFVNPETGKLRKFRTFLVIVVGLFILGAIFGDGDSPEATSGNANNSTQQNAEVKKEDKVAKIGEKATAGKLAYTITKVQEKDVLSNALGSKKPGSGKYLIIDVTIENLDNEGRSVSEGMTWLEDKEGNKYEPDSSAFMYLGQANASSNSSLFDKINPKGKKEFKYVFDVAGSKEDYVFVGTGGFDLLDNGEVRIELKEQ